MTSDKKTVFTIVLHNWLHSTNKQIQHNLLVDSIEIKIVDNYVLVRLQREEKADTVAIAVLQNHSKGKLSL